MTNARTSCRLTLRNLGEHFHPQDENKKATIDALVRYGGVPTATVGIYRRGEIAWYREDTVNIATGKNHVIGEQAFWERISDEINGCDEGNGDDY